MNCHHTIFAQECEICYPPNEEFWKAYAVIMEFIDTRSNTRKLFHALLNVALELRREESE